MRILRRRPRRRVELREVVRFECNVRGVKVDLELLHVGGSYEQRRDRRTRQQPRQRNLRRRRIVFLADRPQQLDEVVRTFAVVRQELAIAEP